MILLLEEEEEEIMNLMDGKNTVDISVIQAMVNNLDLDRKVTVLKINSMEIIDDDVIDCEVEMNKEKD